MLLVAQTAAAAAAPSDVILSVLFSFDFYLL